MATFNVSTMTQLYNALPTCSNDDVIEINADLDFNEILSNPNVTFPMKIGGTTEQDTISNVTINGNNHAIYNLYKEETRYETLFEILYLDGLTINNLSYLNCNISGSPNMLSGIWKSTHGNDILFDGGVIQGRFFRNLIFGTSITVRNMMITADYSNGNLFYAGSGAYNVDWVNCWFRVNRCTCTGYLGNNFNRCYIEGNVVVNSSSSNYTMFNNVKNSCINLTTNVTSDTLNSFCVPNADASVTPNIINITNVHGIVDESSTTSNKAVTETEIKNAEYLASIGFDIIP